MIILRRTDMINRNDEFLIMGGTKQSQMAIMVLQPGEDSGEYGNEHPESDQIMVVLEGQAEATVNDEELTLDMNDVLLIAAGEPHQIRCRGKSPLRTINFYSPPAY